jgi:hypothetical protein
MVARQWERQILNPFIFETDDDSLEASHSSSRLPPRSAFFRWRIVTRTLPLNSNATVNPEAADLTVSPAQRHPPTKTRHTSCIPALTMANCI